MKDTFAFIDQHWDKEFEERAVIHTRELVKFNSSNPPGDESGCARYAAEQLRASGYNVQLEEYAPNRFNVVACFGNPNNIGLILNGHLDVVPVVASEWTYPPFDAIEKDGYIYGRGASDMKSGCASIIAAMQFLQERAAPRGKGVLALLVGDEEQGNTGVKHQYKKMGKFKADAAIVAEPTDLNVHLGHRGYASFYVHAKGFSCHASDPSQGDNAIYRMAKIINRLEEYAKIVNQQVDPVLGKSAMSVGTIHGGLRVNIVPDKCTIEVEQRYLPGDTEQNLLESYQKIVGDDGIVEYRHFLIPSIIAADHPFVSTALNTVRRYAEDVPAQVDVFTGCTEAGYFSEYSDIPTIILGPGSLNEAHRVDEKARTYEMRCAAKIFAALGLYYGGK